MFNMRALSNTPFQQVRRDVERLFGELDRDLLSNTRFGLSRFPALNVFEDGDAYVVEAELPGVSESDMTIESVGKQLQITGKRNFKTDESTKWHRRERITGEFSRTLTLPTDVDAENVAAELRNGLLTIRLPKAAAALPRKIEVKAG